MNEEVAETPVLAAGAYLAFGLALGLVFVFRGISRLDNAADGASFWFRLFVLPGAALLWPIVLARWISGRQINQPIAVRDGDALVSETEPPQ